MPELPERPPVHPFRPRTWPASLWAMLAVAAAVRLPGITYGLPSLFFHHDEPQIVLRALRYGTGDFNPHAFRWPGTWCIDLMFLLYAALFLAGRVAGAWHGSADFAAQYFADPSVFYLVGRVASLVLGLLTLPLLFSLAQRTVGRRAAPWAAALLALNWLHADLSRVGVPTVPMLFWMTLALWLMSDPAPPRPRRSALLGAACGWAAACLYYGGWALLAWPGVLAARAGAGGLRARVRAALGGHLWVAALGAAAAFLVACPFAALDARTFWHDLRFVNVQYATWHSPVPRALLPLVNVYEVGCLVMPELLGWAAWLAALWGGVRAWRVGAPWARGVLLFVAGFTLLLLTSRYQMPRYAMPLLPVACVFGGLGLAELWPKRGARVLVALTLGWCVLDSGRVAVDRTRPDTRELAKTWVEGHIPVGSRMVVDALHHRNTFTAPLDLAPQNVRDKLSRLGDESSLYGSATAYRLYYLYLLQHPGRRPYDQEWTENAERLRPLEEYRRLGFRYAMVSSLVYDGYRAPGGWQDNPAGRFYGGLERGCRLVAEFPGDRFLHPGPTIRIYDLKP